MKRLTSIDFMRGIAIFFTAMMHFLFTSWEKFSSASVANIFSEPIGMIITAAIIFVLIHWRGFFIMISAVANFYQMESAAKKGKNVWGIFGKQLFAGFILILVGKLWTTVFPYWGFIERWSRGEAATLSAAWMESWDMFFITEAIGSIGVMMIITAFFFLLFQLIKGKHSWIYKMAICYTIGIVILIISPMVQQWAATVSGNDIFTGENFRIDAGSGSKFSVLFADLGAFFANFGIVMKKVVLNWIGGREAPLFPMMGSYFFGMGMVYILVGQDQPKKKHLRLAAIPAYIALIWGVIEFLFIEGGGFLNGAGLDLGFHIHPRWFAFVSFGLQVPLVLAMFSWIEFSKNIDERNWLRFTRWIRRFGTFTLTVYFLGIFDFLIRFLLGAIFPATDFISRYGLNGYWSWGIACGLMVIWTFGLYLWDRVARGYGSFEFLLSLMKIPKAGRKRDWKDPIGLRGSLWDVEMISYVK